MYNIIVGGQIHPSGIELLRSIDNFNVSVLSDASQETLNKNIHDADAILLRLQSFSKSLIDQCPKLKILSRNGVGYDRIDIPELTKRKIPLTTVGDVNSSSVAEHTIMLILDLLKSTRQHDQMVRSENWKDRDLLISNDFENKRILIIGFGRIGQKVAKIADAFGAKILVFDPYINTKNSLPLNYQIIDKLDTGLKQADIITLHAPGTTEPIINKREISLMKKVRLEIALNDDFIDSAIEAISSVAKKEGEKGRGKIFILPIEECIRIRTGEKGEKAIG